MQIALLCLKIFLSRIIDVSLGTVRTILTVREKTLLAALVGLCEVTIWFLVVREALTADVEGIIPAIAYAGGFATGTFIGGKIAHRFINSNVTVQIVTSGRNDALVERVRAEGFAVTVVDVNSSEFANEKFMLFAEIHSRNLPELKKIVSDLDPHAFFMVQETKYVWGGMIRK